jgi:hyperosmotically inducible protein
MTNKYTYIFTTAITLAALNIVSSVHAATSTDSSTIQNIIPDTTITAAIKSKYLTDGRISGLNIHVETINGKVTLTGVVPNDDIEEIAELIAKNTNGVKEVISKLETTDASKDVKTAISDTAITAAIKSKYLADDAIKSLDIHIETINARVTLTGIVPNEETKKHAELIAKNTNGVKEVINKTNIQ